MSAKRELAMGTKTARSAVAALAVATLLALPAGLGAQAKRGATVVVTLTDGQEFRGELIAVRGRSIVLAWSSAGEERSFDAGGITKVRIVRRSRAMVGALAGMGLIGGLLLVNGEQTTEEEAAIPVGIALCGLVGAVAGAVAGFDRRIPLAGQSEETLAAYLDKLQARSREGRLAGVAAPAGSGASGHRPRFRLNLSVSRLSRQKAGLGGISAFRFPDEPVPEAGPHAMDTALYHMIVDDAAGGPISLSYEWTPHWAAEIEYAYLGRSSILPNGEMAFTSGTDGLGYAGEYWAECRTRLSSLLAGVTFRPFALDAFARHALELGAALGPAFFRGTSEASEAPFSLPELRKNAFCGRVRASYDYYLSDHVSIGAFAGYRLLEAHFTGLESSGLGSFQVPGLEDPPTLERPTTVSLPELSLDAGGIYWGLRIGFRI